MKCGLELEISWGGRMTKARGRDVIERGAAKQCGLEVEKESTCLAKFQLLSDKLLSDKAMA